MILPNGDICRSCKTVGTHYTHHRSRGWGFEIQHYRLVPCGPEHAELWEKAKKPA